jgi:hypothetical protein
MRNISVYGLGFLYFTTLAECLKRHTRKACRKPPSVSKGHCLGEGWGVFVLLQVPVLGQLHSPATSSQERQGPHCLWVAGYAFYKNIPLKTEFLIINIREFSSYLAGNALHFYYKDRSVNAVYGNSYCWLWEPYGAHKYTLWGERRVLVC